MARRLDPPPFGLPMYDNQGMVSDWTRWFDDVTILTREARVVAAIGVSGLLDAPLFIIDGGIPVETGPPFDAGGPS